MPWEAFAATMNDELACIYHPTRRVLPVMRRRRSGRTVYVSAAAAELIIGNAAQPTAKAAVNAFARQVAGEAVRDGITVAPGGVGTGVAERRSRPGSQRPPAVPSDPGREGSLPKGRCWAGRRVRRPAVTDPRQQAAPPVAAQRPRRPRTVVLAGVLGLAASLVWLVGTYWFWYYNPALPALGGIAFAALTVAAWRGNNVLRVMATVVGVGEALYYGPGGLVADALLLVTLILLYLPASNAYFRRPAGT